jgi:hypothetical protein
MIRYCPLRVVVKIAHSSGKTSRLAPLAKSGDNARVRQDAAGPRSNSRVPDGEQIDGFKGLCGGPSEIETNSIAVLPPQEIRACASKKTA